MKKGKRIIVAVVALVLVVIGMTVAVTSILSSPNQRLGTSLEVSYVASDVKAEVKVEYAKIVNSTNPVTIESTDYSTASGTAKTSFYATQAPTQGSVVAPEVALGFGTGDDSDTFYRGVIYRFTITNKYATGKGCPMTVKAQYNPGTYVADDGNVLCAWAVGQNSQADLTITLPADKSANWNTPTITGATSSGSSTYLETERVLNNNVAVNNGLTCLYLVVVIKDTTLMSNFDLNSNSSTNRLLFTLTGNTSN